MSQNFEFNLSLVLGHSLVYESSCEYANYDFRCEDDPKAPRVTKSAQDLTAALSLAIPEISQLSNQAIGPTEQALLAAAQQTQPGFAQLNQNIFANAMRQLANTQTELAKGPGKEQALALDALARQIDPEVYAARAGAGSVIGNTAGQLNNMLTKPVSEGELSAIERGLNRLNTSKGLGETPSNLSTISNAMTFGAAGRDRLTQAIQLATGFVPAASGFIPAAKTYDKSTTGDVASAMAFSGGPRQVPALGSTSGQTSGALLGESSQTQRLAQEINANRLSGWEKGLAAAPNVSY